MNPENGFLENETNLVPELREEIFRRVTDNSKKFDEEIKSSRIAQEKEVEKEWTVQNWKIDDTEVMAIGVSHVAETFLNHREEIERSIAESDIVVNEFNPEAQGFYDQSSASRLAKTKSKFNPKYNLEELRQEYLEVERISGIGTFHHEVELLTAKHQKDLAGIDLGLNEDVEDALQGSTLYSKMANSIEEKRTTLKRLGLFAGGTATTLLGIGSFMKGLSEKSKEKGKISRRKFLGSMAALAGAAAMTSAPNIVKPEVVDTKESLEAFNQDYGTGVWRNAHIAEGLTKLAKEKGYKKITFIYGHDHLEPVKEYLDNPRKIEKDVELSKDEVNARYPDHVRIYKLAPGTNNSDRFTASENVVWERIDK